MTPRQHVHRRERGTSETKIRARQVSRGRLYPADGRRLRLGDRVGKFFRKTAYLLQVRKSET